MLFSGAFKATHIHTLQKKKKSYQHTGMSKCDRSLICHFHHCKNDEHHALTSVLFILSIQ